MEENNRRPEDYLKQLQEEENISKTGKLKIFFGYAAGVGKTYAMLKAAHDIKKAGIDVVVGYIEPHTRPETAALLDGLEQLPTKSMKYHELTLQEFDLDGALTRRPEAILVDELAHTNVSGSRHIKRYQDIQELLREGIDVYTSVNVQHIEGLKDKVAGITGIIVKERIPDSIFDKASQVELVDIEPEELIARLKQGKIYKEKQVHPALSHFFVENNLVALREIALRRMADRVNLIQGTRNNYDASGENTTAEHILICLSASPSNEKVIRQAARMAAAFHGKFTAIFVETPEYENFSKEDLERLRKNTRLAEQLGANTVTSSGSDIVGQIAEYAKMARVSKLVLGRTYTKRSWFSMKESFSEALTKLTPQLEIFLIPDAYDKKYVKKKSKIRQEYKIGTVASDGIRSLIILIISTAICYLFSMWGFSDANLIMVYILGVLVNAMITKYKIFSMALSILNVLAFNFCFIQPIQTFSVNDPGYIVTFGIMLITAFISATLTRTVKNYAKLAVQKSYRTEILLKTSQKLQRASSGEEIALSTARQLSELLERNVLFYLGNPYYNQEPIVFRAHNAETIPNYNQDELAVAQWVYRNNKRAGFSTSTLPGVNCLYLAVRNSHKVFAVVGIDMKGKELQTYEEGLMNAVLNECALALEKEEVIKGRKEAEIKLQNEQLRGNLLRSISHDLRTPLTSISGNASVLISNSGKISEERKQGLYLDIFDDSAWLINLVENLLSVTRIENGTMELNFQNELIDEIITEALRRVNRKQKEHIITVLQEDDLLMGKVDTGLMIQVLINLIDNAIKYTPSGSTIQIATMKKGQDVVIEVRDNGPGILDEDKVKLFDMFYMVKYQVADGRRGMGLGLNLCQSIIQAHGGQISVHDNVGGGTIIRFTVKAVEVTVNEC